jgi:cytoskeletal protein CcmA (bactofilin family)
MSMRSTSASELTSGYDAGDASEQADASYSLIDRHSVFDGTFRANRNLRIEGEVKGTIECKGMLFVAQGANVSAKVEAESITVAGDLNGEVQCQGRLQIMPSGRVRGKVTTVTLVINEGAYYEGQLEMTPPEQRAAVAPPRPLSSVPPVSITSAQPRPAAPPVNAAPAEPAPASTFIRRLGGPETPWEKGGEGGPEDGDEDGEA